MSKFHAFPVTTEHGKEINAIEQDGFIKACDLGKGIARAKVGSGGES